jgi:hypothetical protein
MLQVVCLSTCLLVAGSVREPGGVGPLGANHEDLKEPRVGISTKKDVYRLWGKPAEERKDKVHTIASWKRGKVTVVLTFNDNLDLLVDRKVLKN